MQIRYKVFVLRISSLLAGFSQIAKEHYAESAGDFAASLLRQQDIIEVKIEKVFE